MYSIRNPFKNRQNIQKQRAITYPEVPPVIKLPIYIDTSIPRGSCNYSNLKYINTKDLIDSDENMYFFNASLCDYNDGYRLFYRVGKNPKGYQDKLATCLLTKNLEVIPLSNKYIPVYSNWKETTQNNENLESMCLYTFKDGEHVEDPRAVFFQNNWFVFYTDGFRIGVAKLTESCEVIYSHYLHTPEITHSDHDGREKNWIPIISDNTIYIIYSETPHTVLTCKDLGDSFEIASLKRFDYTVRWGYGNVRGGSTPCKYGEDKLIWFFHSALNQSNGTRIYLIGAYVTTIVYPFELRKISKIPLLCGIPAPQSELTYYSNNVVFPCGAVNTDSGWRISMGINDVDIGILDVKESDIIWKN